MVGQASLRWLYWILAALLVAAASSGAPPRVASVTMAGDSLSLPGGRPSQPRARITPAAAARVIRRYGKLPLSFEANRGQSDSRVRFLARGRGYTLFLTPVEALLSLWKGGGGAPAMRGAHGKRRYVGRAAAEQAVLHITLAGANAKPHISGADRLPGRANYFIGNDPKKWHVGVPTYAKVTYAGVYPGIDLVYYGKEGRLEYDFVLAPGADPNRIALAFAGARGMSVDPRGGLRIALGSGKITWRAPRIYQEIGGVRRRVAGRYKLVDADTIGFAVPGYRPDRPLVIDPALAYSTYLGGSGDDQSYGIAVGSDGSAYVTGYTGSRDFPTTTGVFQTTPGGGGTDAFVAKLSSNGKALEYSTYLGGSGDDAGNGIALDAEGDAYVTGKTGSTNFPTTTDAYQATHRGAADAFVTKLNSSGTALRYSTYLGGTRGNDGGQGIAVDPAGNAYVTGYTDSMDFPTTSGAYQPTYGGGYDAFVTKLNSSGTALRYSTFLGGGEQDVGRGIAVDSAGNAYVTGNTRSATFPISPGSAYQTTYGGDSDAFVTKLKSSGAALAYSTFLGGSGSDAGWGIAVGADGSAYVTGETSSAKDFPTTSGAYQTAYGSGNTDAFVAKLNGSGTGLSYSTYLGGGGDDLGYGIALDTAGNAYVTGYTTSTNFPVINGMQAGNRGGFDAFVAKLNGSGTGLDYSTYLGGSSADEGWSIAVDTAGNAYVTGNTYPAHFPITAGAAQSVPGGGYDAFVAKLVPDTDDDRVADTADACPDTPSGEIVDAKGCAISQLCPCIGHWKNHGAYVSCVARTAKRFMENGLITEAEKNGLSSKAGRSSCGH